MFNYIHNRTARTIVRSIANINELMGREVRQDRDGADRYFFSADTDYRRQTKFIPQQLIAYRKKKLRWGYKKALTRMEKYEQTDNPFAVLSDYKHDTFNEWHLGISHTTEKQIQVDICTTYHNETGVINMTYGLLYFKDIDDYMTAVQRCIRHNLRFEGTATNGSNGFWYQLEILQEIS